MARLELLLFTTDGELARRAVAAGIDGFIIDWECRGKERRQQGADTQINHDTLEDLIRMRAATSGRILVRISQYGATTGEEIARAVDGGADELLLPMVETEDEVRRALDLTGGRVKMGILIETIPAVACAERLGALPLSRVFLGLNDLSIQRGVRNIFVPVIDGTLEQVRAKMKVPFGFGGLTLPEGGTPIPCRLLMGEMARLGTAFTFLRRSFLRDTAGQDLGKCVERIRSALQGAARRRPLEVRRDWEALVEAVMGAEDIPESVMGVNRQRERMEFQR